MQNDESLAQESERADRAVLLLVLQPVPGLWHSWRWKIQNIADEGQSSWPWR